MRPPLTDRQSYDHISRRIPDPTDIKNEEESRETLVSADEDLLEAYRAFHDIGDYFARNKIREVASSIVPWNIQSLPAVDWDAMPPRQRLRRKQDARECVAMALSRYRDVGAYDNAAAVEAAAYEIWGQTEVEQRIVRLREQRAGSGDP